MAHPPAICYVAINTVTGEVTTVNSLRQEMDYYLIPHDDGRSYIVVFDAEPMAVPSPEKPEDRGGADAAPTAPSAPAATAPAATAPAATAPATAPAAAPAAADGGNSSSGTSDDDDDDDRRDT
jgi:hypothetical protein